MKEPGLYFPYIGGPLFPGSNKLPFVRADRQMIGGTSIIVIFVADVALAGVTLDELQSWLKMMKP